MFLLFFFLTFCMALSATKWHELHKYDFDKYVIEFNKQHYTQKEMNSRQKLFNKNLYEIQQHNKNAFVTWKRGVNKFTDMTNDELKMFLGSKKTTRHTSQYAVHDKKKRLIDDSLPQKIDWRDYDVITGVKDQGRCGSCWSFSASEAIESYYAISNGRLPTLSEQQILDCTSNAMGCGNDIGGGCNGGTVERAFDQIGKMGGLASEWTYPYTSYFGDSNYCNKTRARSQNDRVSLKSYVVLPPNEYQPLLEHLALVGPPSISVDASAWFSYESGVFNGCNKTNPDINHAVQLVSFGTDDQFGDYWGVRNSWGTGWGEEGYIRLYRSPNVECGMDLTPENGNGCPGDPPVKVCGTCGILFDSVYPIVA